MARLQLGVEIEVAGARELDKVADNLTGVGDEFSDVVENLDDAAGSASDVAKELDRAADKAEDTNRSLGDLGGSVDGLADAAGGAVESLSGIGQILEGDIVGGVQDLAGGLADVAQGVVEGVIPAFQAVKDGALTSAATVAQSIGSQVAAWATLGVQSLIHAAKVALAWVIALGPIALLAAAVVAVVALIILNWEHIVNFLRGVFENIGQMLGNLGDFFTKTWNGILKFLGSVVQSVAGIGKRLWEPIGKGFGAAIDFIKGIWNRFVRFWNGIQISVPSIDIPFIGRVGGFSVGLPDLPYLAEGGIVSGPTLAVLGERGPEAVVPLDRGGQFGPSITVNVNGNLEASERTLPGTLLRTLYVAGLTD